MGATMQNVAKTLDNTQMRLAKAYGTEFKFMTWATSMLIKACRIELQARDRGDSDTQEWYALEREVLTTRIYDYGRIDK